MQWGQRQRHTVQVHLYRRAAGRVLFQCASRAIDVAIRDISRRTDMAPARTPPRPEELPLQNATACMAYRQTLRHMDRENQAGCPPINLNDCRQHRRGSAKPAQCAWIHGMQAPGRRLPGTGHARYSTRTLRDGPCGVGAGLRRLEVVTSALSTMERSTRSSGSHKPAHSGWGHRKNTRVAVSLEAGAPTSLNSARERVGAVGINLSMAASPTPQDAIGPE